MDAISKEFPAFPRNYEADGHNGMTLRDYFAAKALQGAIHHRGFGVIDEARNKDCADAYAYADAMLRARGA